MIGLIRNSKGVSCEDRCITPNMVDILMRPHTGVSFKLIFTFYYYVQILLEYLIMLWGCVVIQARN